jgi:RNA polymerase sigma-70 factor (ECF subfamily)
MIGIVTDGGRARFWAGLSSTRRSELEAAADWQARLAAALDDPARSWPRSWVAPEQFAAELAARLDHDDEPAVRWWQHLRADDLYLATACARGVADAIERFERRYGDEIGRTARRFERPGLAADDLVQLLRTKLFTGDAAALAPERRPRIASYTGQGFLQNWVRVTATRTFIDCCRGLTDVPEVSMRNELAAGLPEPGADPELQLLKREHLAHFKAAFAEAAAALDASHRIVLKQHLVERLTIDQIGGLYHLHRASAARRIAKAREALLAGTRAALARRLGVPPERLGSVLELVASRLEASVERLLG